MNKSGLSACIITKNEESNIARCINSIKDIADEIIVLDTGSTDKTTDIANSLGAKVYNHTWNNNFSDARNACLDKASMEWIISIDADEELEISNAHSLKNLLNSTTKEGVYLKLINIIGGQETMETSSFRIFRNRPLYRYEGALHEQIFNSIVTHNKDASFELTNIKLFHYGYDHNIVDMNKKTQRNISILNSVPDEDRTGFYYFSLGNEFMKLNDILEANKCFLKSLKVASPDFGHKPYLAVSIAKNFYSLQKYSTALNYINDFIQAMPDFRDLYFLQGVCYADILKYTLAITSFNQFLSLPKKDIYPSFNFEQSNPISQIIDTLSKSSIPHSKNLISCCIVKTTSDNHILDTIRSINEICDDVVVIDISDSLTCNESIIELNAMCFKEPSLDYDSAQNFGFKLCKGKWILLLKENEVFSHESRYKLFLSILTSKCNGIEISIKNSSIHKDLRVFKNTFESSSSFNLIKTTLKEKNDYTTSSCVIEEKI